MSGRHYHILRTNRQCFVYSISTFNQMFLFLRRIKLVICFLPDPQMRNNQNLLPRFFVHLTKLIQLRHLAKSNMGKINAVCIIYLLFIKCIFSLASLPVIKSSPTQKKLLINLPGISMVIFSRKSHHRKQ